MAIKLSALIKENKHVGGEVTYDDGSVVRGNFIERIFEQDNGKFCYILSKKEKVFDSKEKIIYLAEGMNDEKHIDALLIISKNVNLNVPSHLRYWNIFLNFLERVLPSKIVLFIIILIILFFYR